MLICPMREADLEHPYSPASRFGPGAAKPPGPTLAPVKSTDQHADAPAIRGQEWSAQASATSHGGDAHFSQLNAEVGQLFEVEERALRDALPDSLLQASFDLHLDNLRDVFRHAHSVGGLGLDREGLLGRLHEAVRWVDAELFGSRPDVATRQPSSAGRLDSGDHHLQTTVLREVQAVASRIYAAARARLTQRWEEASSLGASAQDALRDEWKRRMEFRFRGRPTSEPRPPKAERPARPPARVTINPEVKPVKTWVAIQLLDPDGNPVGNVAYEVTLPDGTTQTGRLPTHGSVRFDGIEPGQCQIRFPEIDAREWRAL